MIRNLSFAVCCVAILLGPVASFMHDASVAAEQKMTTAIRWQA